MVIHLVNRTGLVILVAVLVVLFLYKGKEKFFQTLIIACFTALGVYIIDVCTLSCAVKGVIALCGMLLLCYYIGLNAQERIIIRSLLLSRIKKL